MRHTDTMNRRELSAPLRLKGQGEEPELLEPIKMGSIKMAILVHDGGCWVRAEALGSTMWALPIYNTAGRDTGT